MFSQKGYRLRRPCIPGVLWSYAAVYGLNSWDSHYIRCDSFKEHISCIGWRRTTILKVVLYLSDRYLERNIWCGNSGKEWMPVSSSALSCSTCTAKASDGTRISATKRSHIFTFLPFVLLPVEATQGTMIGWSDIDKLFETESPYAMYI